MHIPTQVSRGHVSPTSNYLIVGAGLIALTALTVGASYINFGNIAINILVAFLIATMKASLVLLYFMHLKYENRLVWAFGIVYPVVLFSLLTGMLVIDVFFRIIPNP